MTTDLSRTMTRDRFFDLPLDGSDPLVSSLLAAETERQDQQLELIAPKNYLSRAVFQAHSSIVALTSVEGYPGRRMHAGTVHLDEIETLAVKRATSLFGCRYANVQPHSGTQANQAVFFAAMQPGDAVVSLALRAGGHLSHGLHSNLAGKWFRAYEYGVREDDGLIDYDEAARVVAEVRPKLLITGGSSYPRHIDFARLRTIADSVGALLLADIAHVAGLVAAGAHPSPFPHAHVVTTSTNKNLRGPRGGLVLSDDEELAARLDRAVFPGIQGGPLPEMICAKAVSFGESQHPAFTEYAFRVLDNARTLHALLSMRGYVSVTGGTDTPLVVLDLRGTGLTGRAAEAILAEAGITCNKNLVPGDPEKPSITSGLRFGTSAITTRGLGPTDTENLGHLIADMLDAGRRSERIELESRRAAAVVRGIAAAHPLYAMDDQMGCAR
jgi:glycine hydroxymethyltransferase